MSDPIHPDPSEQDKRSFLLEAFSEAIEPEGFRIDGYEILEELDRGGMGVVYLALQLNPEREVALKVMLPKYSGDFEMRERFQLEAQAMATLDHPSILPIYEVGTSDSFPFFSMKLAQGGSLAERLEKNNFEPREASKFLREIARAVHHAHQRGILHRDLKPGNFLFDSKGQVFVSDFGVAKVLDGPQKSITQTMALVGTPHYLPPEIAGGSSKATTAADIYSLGAVFYECLTGKKPFPEHENLASQLRAIVDETISFPRQQAPKVPRDLETICLKALEKDPLKRYSSAAALADDLQRWEEGHTIHARAVHPIEWAWRWCQRHVLASSLFAALIVVAIASSTILILQEIESKKALEKQQKVVQEQLHESLVGQAKAERLLAAPGFRQRSLDLLQQASEIKSSPRVREEAIATLAKMDLTFGSHSSSASTTWTIPTDPSYEILRRIDYSDGEWALVFYRSGEASLWKRSQPSPIHTWSPLPGQDVTADFLTASSTLLVAGSTEHLLILQGDDFQKEERLLLLEKKRFLVSSPTENLVAIGGTNGLCLYSIEEKDFRWEKRNQNVRCAPSWSFDGQYLAVAQGEEKGVTILNAANGSSVVNLWTTGWPEVIAFDSESRLLAVGCDDGSILIFDLVTRETRAALTLFARELGFSPDNQFLWAVDEEGEQQQWLLQPALGYREWQHDLNPGRKATVHSIQLSPNGNWLLLTNTLGVEMWSVEDGRRVGFYSAGNQRIDAPTMAWWLPGSNHELLVQVPGAWEVLRVEDDGDLTLAHPWERRVPGVLIRSILADGTWLVDELDEDGNSLPRAWPEGDFTSSQAFDSSHADRLSSLTAYDAGFEAKVLTDGTIRVTGNGRDLLLTAPRPISFKQILFAEDGKRLLAVGIDHRIVEWNLQQLEGELRNKSF